jgi:8-oxo-dGTP diphosphatase
MNKVVVANETVDLKRGVDFIGVTINFLIHDGKGNLLLQKRSQNCRDEKGRWDIGGGAVEFGEKLEDAVRREIAEELMTEPLEITFLKTYEALRDNEGVPTQWMAFVHAVKVDPNTVKIGEPHKIDEIGWFTSKNLPSPLHSMFHNVFDYALELGLIR